ncbi:MAG: hypothetical protein ACJ79K_03975 [Gemmatimonadaceae bacterium]
MTLAFSRPPGCYTALSAMLVATVLGPRPGAAQSSSPTDTVTARGDSTTTPDTTVRPVKRPLTTSVPVLALTSMGGAAVIGVDGAVLGNLFDSARCERKHRGEQPEFLFGPCFLYVSDGTKAGWFAGSFVGATAGAVIMARQRGCPTREAIWRASAGSVLGLLPGLVTASHDPQHTPPSRSIRLGTAPLLGGLGAVLAVAGCHR